MYDKIRAQLGVLVAQLFFIAAGVYLGMQGDEWREAREHRAAARAALENFRTELIANRDQLRVYAPIYDAYADSLARLDGSDLPPPRSIPEVFRRLGWRGLNPMRFRHTAWDLALATQSLSYLPPPLAFRIASVYTGQEIMQDVQGGVANSLFAPGALDDARIRPFLFTFMAYVEDSRIQARRMSERYAAILPALDSAIARHRD